eukprot:Skav220644  [mRNA]  locus=scaffold112:658979:660630:- [translate_table: standard]
MIEAEAEAKAAARGPAAHQFVRSWVCECQVRQSFTLKSGQPVSSTCRPSKQTANNGIAQDDYDLTDPKEFARFLQDADIGLIRLEYLVHLVLSKRLLPRRQEAEGEVFTKDGETRSALVSHEELQRWSHGTQIAQICSISHAWETREHPDPCGHQLQHVVNHCGLFSAAFEADVWVFYDYTSLFQFEREKESHEEKSFRRSMENMHLLYAHEYSLTFRIQNLTRECAWNKMMQNDTEMVQVWVQGNGLELKPLKALVANRTPYGERGWCKAEIEWSSLRGINAQFQQIDKEPLAADSFNGILADMSGEGKLHARVPTAPTDFQRQMEQAAFTHRSDASAVIQLQEKIFIQKVTECEELLLEGLPASEMWALAHALPQYTKLKSLAIRTFRCEAAKACCAVEACCALLARRKPQLWRAHETTALAEACVFGCQTKIFFQGYFFSSLFNVLQRSAPWRPWQTAKLSSWKSAEAALKERLLSEDPAASW